MAKEAIKDEELAGLSEEEVKALNDDDDTDGETTEAVVEDSAEPVAETKVEVEVETDTSDDKAATTEKPVAEEFTPQYKADPVEDYDDKMTALNEKKSDLKTQYEDGDITVAELLDARDDIEKESRAMESQQTKFEMSQEQAKQTGEQRWQWEQDRFFNAEENSAYNENPILNAAIDTAVKALANDKTHEGKPMSWFLEEADRQVRGLFKIQPEVEVEVGKGSKRANTANIPPNLGDLPAAELSDTGTEDEFDKLDKMDGMDLEKALARMTKDDEDRYLKG